MYRLIFVAASTTMAFASAHAAKPCAELKTEIAAKLEAKGVKAYTLEVVGNDQAGDGKIVGSCDGGTKKIVYTKAAPAQPPQADAAK